MNKRVLIFFLIVITQITLAYGESFSCLYGKQASCLDYGDKICPSNGKCVDDDSVCFNSSTCSYDGFVCKSEYNDVARKLNNVASEYDDLVHKYNSLLSKKKSLIDCVAYASSLAAAKLCY